MTNPRILSHRGCLSGRMPGMENTLVALHTAGEHGFDVEFDIQLTPDRSGLVLSHDPMEWAPERDAVPFLTQTNPVQTDSASCHALNVKNLFALPAIADHIQQAQAKARFFLFDFELLTQDFASCRYLMRSMTEQGFQIAYRLSEREPYLEEYAQDSRIERIWLDEMEGPWITRDHIRQLTDHGKTTCYVSPELHSRMRSEDLPCRWEQIVTWGASAICTDYPLQLEHFLEGRTKEQND